MQRRKESHVRLRESEVVLNRSLRTSLNIRMAMRLSALVSGPSAETDRPELSGRNPALQQITIYRQNLKIE